MRLFYVRRLTRPRLVFCSARVGAEGEQSGPAGCVEHGGEPYSPFRLLPPCPLSIIYDARAHEKIEGSPGHASASSMY
jgi:hypothetical protein